MIVHTLIIASVLPVALTIEGAYFIGGVFIHGKNIIPLDTPVSMFKRPQEVPDHIIAPGKELRFIYSIINMLVKLCTTAHDERCAQRGIYYIFSIILFHLYQL